MTLILILSFVWFRDGVSLEQIYETTDNNSSFILSLRLNAVITALVTGAALSIVGLFLQTLFHNPLGSPFTLGVSSVSSLFISMSILFSGLLFSLNISHDLLLGFQVIFSLLGAFVCLYFISKIQKKSSSSNLIILVGILIGTFSASIQQVVELFMSQYQLKSNFMWSMGSFEIVDSIQVMIYSILLCILVFVLFKKTRDSNLYLLGNTYAINMGLDIAKYQKTIFVLSALVVALVTAFCGPIGFIGLIAPHICKMLLKSSDHRKIFSTTLILGSFIAVLCLWISHSPFLEVSLPINILTAILGVPFTIYIMTKSRSL